MSVKRLTPDGRIAVILEMRMMVNVRALAACATAASRETSRPYLCGVHILRDATGITYSATNGHVAILLHKADGGGEEIDLIVPSELCLIPGCTAPVYEEMVIGEGDLPSLQVNGRVGHAISGPFPDLFRLVPTRAFPSNAEHHHISPAVSGVVLRASEILVGKKKAKIFASYPSTTEDCGEPVIGLFAMGKGLEGFALMMPMRMPKYVEQWERPGWVDAKRRIFPETNQREQE